MERNDHLFAVIMAGGSGTRFWPLSREKMPKQLLKIGANDTLIQQTVKRILPLMQQRNILIVTNQALSDPISHQLTTEFSESWDMNFILEPQAKNTAPALGLAALHINRIDPDGVMAVFSADHSIRKADDFLNLLRRAVTAAEDNYLVTFGIKPDRPETGYGYIKAGEKIAHGPRLGADGKNANEAGICNVEAFVEKPDVDTARNYLADGRYYWNSGIFVWKTSVLLQEIERHAPALYGALKEIEKSIGTESEAEVVKNAFQRLESISVDYAVMEKTDRAAVIPADIGWSDVGSWTALDDVSQRDASGNIISGNVLDFGSCNSILYAEKRLVATIGLKDTVVVDTPDATLVCSKERAQDVKKVVDVLKTRKSGEHLIHRTVHRPWGSYTILEEGDRYKIKRLEIHPGAKLSHQLHHHRSEHWVVVSGTARVMNGDREYDVHPNESTYIPISTKHRLENRGKIPLQIIEVQNGEYLEEDDIVRFDDVYNRLERNKRRPLPEVKKSSSLTADS